MRSVGNHSKIACEWSICLASAFSHATSSNQPDLRPGNDARCGRRRMAGSGLLDNFIDQAEGSSCILCKARPLHGEGSDHERLEGPRFVRVLRPAQRACGPLRCSLRHRAILDVACLTSGVPWSFRRSLRLLLTSEGMRPGAIGRAASGEGDGSAESRRQASTCFFTNEVLTSRQGKSTRRSRNAKA